jgi:hypothetical protein
MTSVVVFGGRLSGSERHLLEDGYVAALTAHGVRATPSYTLFPDGRVGPEPNAIRTTLLSAGYDGALVSTMRGASERILVAPGADWAGGFDGAYSAGSPPVAAALDQVVAFETTFWSARSGQMVWSANTRTDNPSSGRDFVSSLTQTVVPSLADAGLIPPGRGKPVSLLR